MNTDLIPGYNVDRIDIDAGVREAHKCGYDDYQAQVVVEYMLARWKRGEEAGAQRTWLSYYPNDLTSFYRIVAAARAEAERPRRQHFCYLGRWKSVDGIDCYWWQAEVPGDSRVLQVRCAVDEFWVTA